MPPAPPTRYAAPVSKALRGAGHNEFLLHTGQHYDHCMSQVFFDEMSIPEPDTNLGIVTNHSCYDFASIFQASILIVNTRNAIRTFMNNFQKIVRI
jgi:UDP-N-acetylglucosamine 2-epimerase